MTKKYENWPEEVPGAARNVADAAIAICKANPDTIVQVKTYKTLSAAKTGITILEKARVGDPDRFEGTWRWVPTVLVESVEVDGVTHVAEIRAMYSPEVTK